MDEKNIQYTVNLTIDELGDEVFAFVKADYSEMINGILPMITADFICETDKFPLQLSEVNMTLIIGNDEWRLIGNLDEFKFNENLLTLYITLTERDFYFVSQSNKYLSVSKAIDSLYYGQIDSEITDNTPRELNQVNSTNYKYLTNILRSMKSPSIFAYTMNGLKIKNVKSNSVDYDFDPDKDKYYIHERTKDYALERNGYAESSAIGLFARDGEKATTLTSWDGIEITHNSDLDDMIENVITNTKFQKQNRLVVRLVFQYVPPVQCGDIVRVDIQDIDQTEFVIIERLGLIGKEVKWSYLLREI